MLNENWIKVFYKRTTFCFRAKIIHIFPEYDVDEFDCEYLDKTNKDYWEDICNILGLFADIENGESVLLAHNCRLRERDYAYTDGLYFTDNHSLSIVVKNSNIIGCFTYSELEEIKEKWEKI